MSNGWYRWLIVLYRILFLPLLLLAAPYYLGRMWRRGGYRTHWQHRFGLVPKPPQPSPLWIQAVSVGELEALHPLLILLKQQAIPVYLTTTTSTGFRVAQKKYQALVDQIAYFPLDFWLFSRNAWRRIRPRAALLMESEIWPEHLFQATKHRTPVYLVNGRCSAKTFSRYCKCLPIARIIFSAIAKIFAATTLDQQRFQHLCPKSVPMIETGNLKIPVSHFRFPPM
jgi:3-deoxy-D-manno-octulosonic-acid transferase